MSFICLTMLIIVLNFRGEYEYSWFCIVWDARLISVSVYLPSKTLCLRYDTQWNVFMPLGYLWVTYNELKWMKHGHDKGEIDIWRQEMEKYAGIGILTYLLTYLLICLLTYLLTYLLTHSVEHSRSWETNKFSASQEIPRILWNPKVHHRIHMCPPPVPILSRLYRVHTPTSHFLKIRLNIILPSMPGSPKWSLSFRFPHQNPVYASSLPHTRYVPHSSHSLRFYHPKNTGWAVHIIKFLIM